jgi:hypothetical protein
MQASYGDAKTLYGLLNHQNKNNWKSSETLLTYKGGINPHKNSGV